MSIFAEERLSDSPYIESVMEGYTMGNGSSIRPAEIHWHLVFVKVNGRVNSLMVGPLKESGVASWGEGAEILWIKFKLGTFMPHLLFKESLDREVVLPEGAGRSFWLNGETWQLPTFDNVEYFVKKLVRQEALLHDPVVDNVLNGRSPNLSPRTVRHRFLQATGLSQTHIVQYARAQQAAALLQQGVSILDTVGELGYFDQPHLTRSLKRFMGTTPAQENGRFSSTK